jgi:outer membrane protein assembly factor BamB
MSSSRLFVGVISILVVALFCSPVVFATSVSMSSDSNGLTSPYWLAIGHDSRNSNAVPWTPATLPKLLKTDSMNGTGFTLAIGKVVYTSVSPYWGGTSNSILSLNLTTDKVIWERNFSSSLSVIYLTASGDGMLFVATQETGACTNCRIFALGQATGNIRWSTTVAYSKPQFADGRVFAVGPTGDLYSFNATTGSTLWTYCCVTNESYGGPVAVGDDRVIATSSSGAGSTVYSINETTGSLIWSTNVAGAVSGYPVLRDQKVFLGTSLGKVYGLNETGGSVAWNYTTNYNTYVEAAENGTVITTSNSLSNTTLFALNDTTGKLMWKYGPNIFPDYGVSIAGSQVIVLASNGVLRSFTLTKGRHLWTRTLPGALLTEQSRVVLSIGRIIVPTRDALYTLRA